MNSGSAGPTDKMSLLTLEHLRLSCEPLITNRTLGYSAGDVGSVGSAHQAQDVQVSLPGDGLQVSALTVHSVKIHPRCVDKAACHLYLVVLETEYENIKLNENMNEWDEMREREQVRVFFYIHPQ